jgi:hypothetical protein
VEGRDARGAGKKKGEGARRTACAARAQATHAWPPHTRTQEYWECTLSACTWQTDDGKGHGPDLIVDDGGALRGCSRGSLWPAQRALISPLPLHPQAT